MYILPQEEMLELELRALAARKNVLRMIKAGTSGHVGGALSIIDTITALYFKVMKIDPTKPKWEERDRFVLSAGHKCLALYAVLAEAGFFEKDILDTYGSLNSKMPGHPDMHKLPGIESNTGALGHGLSIGVGMALGIRVDGGNQKVFVAMGDGELAEGSNWEAAAAASHHQLDNLLVFVDRNRLQISGPTVEVMSYEPLDERWRSFGWQVQTINAHDMKAIVESAVNFPAVPGQPTCIILDSVKAKGLSFAEDKVEYHYWKANRDEMAKADKDLTEIEARLTCKGN